MRGLIVLVPWRRLANDTIAADPHVRLYYRALFVTVEFDSSGRGRVGPTKQTDPTLTLTILNTQGCEAFVYTHVLFIEERRWPVSKFHVDIVVQSERLKLRQNLSQLQGRTESSASSPCLGYIEYLLLSSVYVESIHHSIAPTESSGPPS